MIAINAHYDGKVLVPDEPLDLPANQKVHILLMETVESQANRTEPAPKRTNFSEWIGLAKDPSGKVHDPGADEDALWEKGPLSRNTDEDAHPRHLTAHRALLSRTHGRLD